jgi:DNA-binding response OmpR family regulator
MSNVLLIEDNPGDARRIREMLLESKDPSVTLAWSDRLSTGLEYLDAHQVDLILLDLSLPDSWGFDTFTKLRVKSKDLPVILLTGLDDEDLAMRAVREGAQDYMMKDNVTAESLARAIRFAIERPRSYRILALSSWKAASFTETVAEDETKQMPTLVR